MDMATAFDCMLGLAPAERRVVFTSPRGVQVTVTHTGKYSTQDFAVGLCIPGRDEFRPTHVRLLVDLYLKRLSNPSMARRLFACLERVNGGADPLSVWLDPSPFPMMLDEPVVNLVCAQLLMVEQDLNFGLGPGATRTSRLNPPHEYLMRFIRWVAAGEEIDKVVTSAVRNYPAPRRFGQPLEDAV